MFRFRKRFPEGIPSGLSVAFFVQSKKATMSLYFYINHRKTPVKNLPKKSYDSIYITLLKSPLIPMEFRIANQYGK